MSHMSYQHQSLQVLKASFSREMYQVVEETFKMLDTANNMVITKAQMDIAEKVMGFLADDDKGSENQSELIDYNRYLSIILERMNKPFFISSESRDAFQVFDKDGNGFLDAVEVKRVFTKLGEDISESELEDQLRHYDVDGDCQMMPNEFLKVVTDKF